MEVLSEGSPGCRDRRGSGSLRYQSDLVGEWGNFSPGGPVISKFRRNLYSFGIGKAKQAPVQRSRAAWGAACKGGDGEEGAADRGGAGRREEGVGNGWGCLPGACGRYCVR